MAETKKPIFTLVTEVDRDTEKQIKRYLKDKVSVYLRYNNELGSKYWLWAVAVCRDAEAEEVWLDAFKTKTDATKFCKRHQLKIIDTIRGNRTH